MAEDASPRKAGSGKRDDLVAWPLGVLGALIAVPVSWLLIGIALLMTHEWLEWPTSRNAGGLLYLAFAIGLVPLALMVLESVARRRGALTTKWFGVDFSKGAAAAERPTIEIERSLGLEGKPIDDSSVVGIHETVAVAGAKEVARLDLGSGDSWWMTRLFALCYGASRRGAPKILVFVGREGGVDHAFLGWIDSSDAYRLLRATREPLRLIADRAEEIARWMTTVGQSVPPPPAPAAKPAAARTAEEQALVPVFKTPPSIYRRDPRFRQLGEETALRVALDLLGRYEGQQQPVGGERLTTASLRTVFGTELREQAIDLQWPGDRQLDVYFARADDYVALVEGGRFDRIVPRSALQNALMRQLLQREE